MCVCVCVCVQVDGEEDIKAGLDLYEFAEVITKLGLQEAVVRNYCVVYIVCITMTLCMYYSYRSCCNYRA